MGKETWGDVMASLELRRAYADPKYNKIRGSGMGRGWLSVGDLAEHELTDSILDKIGGSQTTFALGWVYSNLNESVMIASFKGASKDELGPLVEQIARHFRMNYLVMLSNTTSGLHAEMQIFRYCIQDLGIKKYDLNLKGFQIMCVGKELCQDCAGYLNKFSIPHLGVYRKKNTTDKVISDSHDGPSTMGGGIWKNPGTLASYGGGNHPDNYQKSGKTINKPFY